MPPCCWKCRSSGRSSVPMNRRARRRTLKSSRRSGRRSSSTPESGTSRSLSKTARWSGSRLGRADRTSPTPHRSGRKCSRSSRTTTSGSTYDPSHLIWQFIDEVRPIHDFRDRIFPLHAKDMEIDREMLYQDGVLGSGFTLGDSATAGAGRGSLAGAHRGAVRSWIRLRRQH